MFLIVGSAMLTIEGGRQRLIMAYVGPSASSNGDDSPCRRRRRARRRWAAGATRDRCTEDTGGISLLPWTVIWTYMNTEMLPGARLGQGKRGEEA